jgi:hypothetical protein
MSEHSGSADRVDGAPRPERSRGTRGEFDHQMVCGGYAPDHRLVACEEPRLGLPFSCTFVYGSVRNGDGDLLTPMRRIRGGDGGGERFLLQTTIGTDALHVHSASRQSARCAGMTRSWDGVAAHLVSSPDASGSPFEIIVSDRSLHWTEGDVLDVTGTLVEPGLHWHLPSHTQGMYYASLLFEVEGTMLDRSVTGFIAVDDLHMDGEIYVDDLFIGEQAEIVWYTWATRYVDGTLDAGHFLLGHGNLGFAVLTDEGGNVTATHDIDGAVELDGDGPWPSTIRLSVAGTDWEFLPDPRGRMADLMPIPNPQIEGRWRRVGDTREPRTWFAWGEIAPSHGLRRILTEP